MLEKFRRWAALHPNWMLAGITILALLPFLAKPFNVDDPLFVWTAKQIQSHPANPYGFDVNWYGVAQPMWSVTENPPLDSYFIALAAKIFGWSEMGLHFAFLFPAVMVILGTHRLAKRFCACPAFAALATLFTPFFLVSATTVMCDVPMLAFWIWSVIFWAEGLEKNNFWELLLAALFISLASLTKYFGVSLLPLLAVYTCLTKRKFSAELAFLLMPVVILGCYEWMVSVLYGHGLFTKAVSFAGLVRGGFGFSKFTSIVLALAFTGGGFAVMTFLSLLLWRRRNVLWLGLIVAVISIVFFYSGVLEKKYPLLVDPQRFHVEYQMVLWIFGGVSILALAFMELWQRRKVESWLLFLWIAGVFIFTAVCNWTVNARSLLPMVPAIGILLARQVEHKGQSFKFHKISIICLVVGGALAMAVVRADCLLAVAVRQCAQSTMAKYGLQNRPVWFCGHWGFQFYMTQRGALEFDMQNAPLKSGDFLVLPANNDSTALISSNIATEIESISAPGPGVLTTLNRDVGAGFYAVSLGPLPFAFGTVPPEKAVVYQLR